MTDQRQQISIIMTDRRSPTFDEEYVRQAIGYSRYWVFSWLGRAPLKSREVFSRSLSIAKKNINVDASVEDAHRVLLNSLRRITADRPSAPLIAISRRRLPGSWFSVSDYSSVCIISTNLWQEQYAPPPVEVFLVKEILSYALLFSRNGNQQYPYHDATRGCLFDAAWAKSEFKAGLWGDLCPQCSTTLSSSGVSRLKQDEVVTIIRSTSGFGGKDVLSKLKSPKIFLSYAREDRSMVDRIHKVLTENGCSVWMDAHDLNVGDEWERKIFEELRDSDFVLICLSKVAISKNGFIQKEIREALDRQGYRPFGRAFIIPVLLDDCEVPHELIRYHHERLDENFHKAMQNVVSAINRHCKEV